MNREAPDPGRIDELLDDKLAPDERTKAIAELVQNPELYEQFIIAARAQLDLTSSTKKESAGSHLPNRWRIWAPLAAAAVIAGLFVVPKLLRPDRGALALIEPSVLSSSIRVGTPWAATGWETRGSQAAPPIDPATRDFRTGVRMIDLQVAMAARDFGAVNLLGSEIVSLLRGQTAGAPRAVRFERALSSIAQDTTLLLRTISESASETRESSATSVMLDAGAWLEQARLAAQAQRASFFHERRTRSELERIINELNETAPTSTLLARLRALAERTQSERLDLAEAGRELNDVIGEMGRAVR